MNEDEICTSDSGALRRDGSTKDLDALREALDDLRGEIRQRFGRGEERTSFSEQADRTLRDSGLEELLATLRRWIGTLGMVERSGDVDEFGMDEVALNRTRPLFDFLFDRYWRVDIEGFEHLPARGPCLIVANRSGLLPYDGLILSHAIERLHASGERPRFSVADWLMTAPFVQPTLARLGGVRACRENAERLLRAGRYLVVFPEGVKGATKVFRERYRLQRFGRGGAIRLALESGAPLVPVGIVGAEETHPVLFRWRGLARALGTPYLPVTPTFPLCGPLGALPLPSKWVIRFGRPIAFGEVEPDATQDELLISRLNEELRAEVQSLVRTGLEARESIWG
jgi:1-acyl-sn-glycerol-3-phosphate acyltransferase